MPSVAMEIIALTHPAAVFHEHELPYCCPVRRSFHAVNVKLFHRQFVSEKSSFPSLSWVAIERSCRAGLGGGNGSLEELNSKYRGSKVYGQASALPNGMSFTVEKSDSSRKFSLEHDGSATASSEEMEDQKGNCEELAQELLVGQIEKEDCNTSEISDSGAKIKQHEIQAPSTSSSTSPPQSASASFASSCESSVEETWLVLNGDASTLAPALPLIQRYAPQRLLKVLSRKLELRNMASPRAALERLRKMVMFWTSWGRKEAAAEERIAPMLGEVAFEPKDGVSQLQQWTAIELALQHGQLRRIARDVLYLVIACGWVGLVRVAEAVVAAFATKPPVYSKLWEVTNALDMFTIAWMAYTLRQPIVSILKVDPINLQEVARLRSQMWEHMHKFYERQWKVVATLAMGRMLGLIATTLPSTEAITKNVKICWDMFLALPMF